MVISRNSQLGLMLHDRNMNLELIDHFKNFLSSLRTEVAKIDEKEFEEGGKFNLKSKQWTDGDELYAEICQKLGYNKELKGSEFYTVKSPNPYYYLIQQTVWDCSEKIRINENFSCVIFNKIKDGEHVYLLGKEEVYRYVKFNGAIRAFYWDRGRKLAFEFGFHLEKDRYYFPDIKEDEFNRLVRLMTFIELGDIEIVEIPKGRNNGKLKNDGKITNTSDFNVYVVDSSWNKLIIRTEGFAVMGHFRLQPCGPGLIDRKLIWINAFEKNGYKRQPKAKIIH